MGEEKDVVQSAINRNITDFVNELLDEVRGKPTAKRGRKPKNDEAIGMHPVEYTLKDKLDVLDRAIKLEALRLKVRDGDEGGGFAED